MSAVLDSDESKINEARRNRLRGLVAQLGLPRADAAALLRSVANDIEPTAECRRLQEAIPAIAANEPGESPPQRNRRAERQRRYRQRKKSDLRVLRAYPQISDECVAALVQAQLIPADVVDRDGEMVDALMGLLRELAVALNNRTGV